MSLEPLEHGYRFTVSLLSNRSRKSNIADSGRVILANRTVTARLMNLAGLEKKGREYQRHGEDEGVAGKKCHHSREET